MLSVKPLRKTPGAVRARGVCAQSVCPRTPHTSQRDSIQIRRRHRNYSFVPFITAFSILLWKLGEFRMPLHWNHQHRGSWAQNLGGAAFQKVSQLLIFSRKSSAESMVNQGGGGECFVSAGFSVIAIFLHRQASVWRGIVTETLTRKQ